MSARGEPINERPPYSTSQIWLLHNGRFLELKYPEVYTLIIMCPGTKSPLKLTFMAWRSYNRVHIRKGKFAHG